LSTNIFVYFKHAYYGLFFDNMALSFTFL